MLKLLLTKTVKVAFCIIRVTSLANWANSKYFMSIWEVRNPVQVSTYCTMKILRVNKQIKKKYYYDTVWTFLHCTVKYFSPERSSTTKDFAVAVLCETLTSKMIKTQSQKALNFLWSFWQETSVLHWHMLADRTPNPMDGLTSFINGSVFIQFSFVLCWLFWQKCQVSAFITTRP